MIDDALAHINCEFVHPLSFWFKRSVTRTLQACHDKWSNATGVPVALAAVKVQRATTLQLKFNRGTSVADKGVMYSFSYLDGDSKRPGHTPVGAAARLRAAYFLAGKYFPAGNMTAGLKTICNWWCTTARLQHHGIKDCPWCSSLGGDHQWHLLSCRKWIVQARNVLARICHADNEHAAQDLYCLLDCPSEREVAQRLIANDLILHCADQARNGVVSVNEIPGLVKARIRFWGLQQSTKYRDYVLSML